VLDGFCLSTAVAGAGVVHDGCAYV